MNHFWDGLTLGIILGIVFVFAGFWLIDITTRGEEWRELELEEEWERQSITGIRSGAEGDREKNERT